MGEKTEQASSKKLKDSAKKGQVAKIQDFPSAVTFMISISMVLWASSFLYKGIATYTKEIFAAISSPELGVKMIGAYLYEFYFVVLKVSLPIAGITAIAGVIVRFLLVGPLFASEVFIPTLNKFNPVENLKAKFKLKTFVELIKSLVKIAVAAYLVYGVVRDSMDVLAKSSYLPILGHAVLFATFLKKVVIKVGIFFLCVAALDLVYQKRVFAKEMMMEKYEVKQEYKDQEGSPEIKGRRKELAREIAYQEGPATAIKKSKALVTNPDHIAVAIKYDPAEGDLAPVMMYKGRGDLALRMMKIAEDYDVPIMRNVSLSHDLFDHGEINQYVPEDTFEAMAEIIRWVTTLKGEEEEQDLGLPT